MCVLITDLYHGYNGLFALLSDECNLVKPQAENYIRNIYKWHEKDVKSSTQMKDKGCFTVKHFARNVCYSAVRDKKV